MTTPRQPLSPLELATKVAQASEEKKAKEVSVLQVDKIVEYADYLVIVSGGNRRQVQAIADEAETVAREHGGEAHVEGYAAGWWVLLDFGSVVLHVLQPEARAYYDLDHLWADAPAVTLRAERASARDLRAAR